MSDKQVTEEVFEDYWHPHWAQPKELEKEDPARFENYEARKLEAPLLNKLPVPQDHDGYKVYIILGLGNLVMPKVERYCDVPKEEKVGAPIVPVHPAACFILDRIDGPNGPGTGGWTLMSLVDVYGLSIEHPIEINFKNLQLTSPLCFRFRTLLWNAIKGSPGHGPQTGRGPQGGPVNIPARPHGEPLVSRFSKMKAEAEKHETEWHKQRDAKLVDSSLILPGGGALKKIMGPDGRPLKG